MKNAVYCILFGILFAIISCSAIRITQSNIKVQYEDTTHYKPNAINESQVYVPSVPANNPINPKPKLNFKPFKDSVINGLINIKQSVDDNGKKADLINSKLDSIYKRQTSGLNRGYTIIETLHSMQGVINNLQLDTARLYKTARLTQSIKDDAVVGNTFKNFSLYVLFFIASGIVVILILIIYFHTNLNRNIRRIVNQHAA